MDDIQPDHELEAIHRAVKAAHEAWDAAKAESDRLFAEYEKERQAYIVLAARRADR